LAKEFSISAAATDLTEMDLGLAGRGEVESILVSCRNNSLLSDAFVTYFDLYHNKRDIITKREMFTQQGINKKVFGVAAPTGTFLITPDEDGDMGSLIDMRASTDSLAVRRINVAGSGTRTVRTVASVWQAAPWA